MDDLTLPLSGLSPVAGRPVKACFDGGTLSSDAGVLVLREVEGRLGVAERLARCLDDRRDPALITHSASDMIRFRMLMIAAGYEDGNDAASLRQDPVFKMAQGIAPSGRHLASQPTISRLENMADVRSLLRMAGAMVDLYCTSFRQVPPGLVLDMDDTFDAVHGGQQLRLFNAHHDEYGFLYAIPGRCDDVWTRSGLTASWSDRCTPSRRTRSRPQSGLVLRVMMLFPNSRLGSAPAGARV